MNRQATMRTLVPSHGKVFWDSFFALAANLRSTIRIHHQNARTSLFRFERDDGNELTPTDIMNVFCQVRIFDHVLDGQIFEFNRVESLNEFIRFLKMKVLSLTLDFFMFPRQQFSGLASVRSFFLGTTTKTTLCCFQFALGFFDEARIFNSFTRRKRHCRFNPGIKTNRFTRRVQVFDGLIVGGENNVPTIHFTRDRTCFDSSLDRTRQANTNRTDTRKRQLVAFKFKAVLWICERVVPIFSFEAGKTRCFAIFASAKECLERFIDATKSFLKDLSVDIFYIGSKLFNRGQLSGLKTVVDRNMVHRPCIPTFLNGGVIKLTTDIQRSLAFGDKLFIRLQFVFERLHHHALYLVPMANQELSSLHHCAFSLNYHLVLVTKYRRKAITKEMLTRLNEIFDETLNKWDCKLLEFNGEEDHVHLLLQTTPVVQLSKLVNNLKTVSSRLIRRDFKMEVNRIYRKPVFWHRAYCIITAGGAPIAILRKYIEEQGTHDNDD